MLAIQNLLIAINHPQPPTTIRTDNSTAAGIVHNNIQMKKSKSWDMNLHWLRDKENLKHFDIIWDKGENNYVDYPKKIIRSSIIG